MSESTPAGGSTRPVTWPGGAKQGTTQTIPVDTTVLRQRPASGQGQSTGKANQTTVATAAKTTAKEDSASQKRPRRTRRARLRVARIDPWSVMKTSLLFGVAGFVMFVVATFLVMTVIDATGLWDAVNALYRDLLAAPNDPNEFEIRKYVSTLRVTGLAATLGAINVVIFTALATVFSFLYNLSATMLGGLEITLAED